MAQLITKFGYLKDNKARSRGGYAKYIATREGVEAPGVEGYLKYMGTRPRVEKQGSHGLFTTAGEPVVLSRVTQELDAHQGPVWTLILSLRREDAQRLGFDSAARWMDLLRSQAGTLAQGLKIAPNHLKWYAAFHNEGHHPHVHLIAYSTKPGEGFLTKQGMEKIRSALAQEIFRQDLVSVYERQTAHRDELRRVSREKVTGLVQQISGGECENPQLESLLRELAQRLSNVKGKKVYGYLRPELKALVNQIVDELAKDSRIAQLYDLWYQDKQAARNVYDERPIERVPLPEPGLQACAKCRGPGSGRVGPDAQSGTASRLYTAPPAHGHPAATAGGADFWTPIPDRPARGPADRLQAPTKDRGEEAGSWTKIQYVDGGKARKITWLSFPIFA